MVPRRRLLLSLATLFTAGCTGQQSTASDPTAAPRTTLASTDTPSSALDCATTTTVDPPRAVDTGDVSPPSYPPFPDSLDATSAGSFVSGYETAYVLNSLVIDSPDATYVDVAVSDSPPVTETERGYVVDLDYSYAVEAETAADYPPRHVAYLVREGVVARAELDPNDPADPFPLAAATVFRCES
ncbi:hypothetical protein C2R22_15880 [Salinigranum rubrum]|uniref:Uncharacterized protein n=1 Tax=Salinigranum rubrum TaxID=755307 RepID=A0A2I8VP96_9EURY|nr:hypothetical protein [Salinigranum rubrum]AUV82939.1 hypothetical protein C2R22_15880 [Salinigranum rubrum]